MITVLKKFFVPHAENNYHPHVLHTKRALFYTLVFGVMKLIVILLVVLLPQEAYLHSDVLNEQYKTILALTNETRVNNKIPSLWFASKLDVSAQEKANDMAKYRHFSHTGSKGRTLAYFLNQAGYNYTVAGENLAVGFSDPQSLVDAWVRSPKHYANLVDRDFTEVGLGLESGIYRDEPVVYVAQHFGNQVNEQLAVIEKRAADSAEINVAGVKVVKPEIIQVDETKSWLYWLENNGSTTLQARVVIAGAVSEAHVTLGSLTIKLSRLVTSSIYVGQITVPGSADQFFTSLVLPTVSVLSPNKKQTLTTVNWFNIKPRSTSFVDQYKTAKKYSGTFTDIFSITKDAYAFFIIFFIVALLVNIVVEVRRQHHHIIVQTMLVIGLLAFLWQV